MTVSETVTTGGKMKGINHGVYDYRWDKLNDEYRSAREFCITLMFVAYVK